MRLGRLGSLAGAGTPFSGLPSLEPESGPSLEPESGPSLEPERGPSLEPAYHGSLANVGSPFIPMTDPRLSDFAFSTASIVHRVAMRQIFGRSAHGPVSILRTQKFCFH
jgi:hypothetical protein